MSQRLRLVVLFGGRSAEHEVSCITATHVLEALDLGRYDVVPVGITSDGRWVLAEDARQALERAEVGLAAGRRLPAELQAVGPEVEPFSAVRPAEGAEAVVFPLLHGPFGEDGTVQGLLEMAGVPFVGAGVLGSALAMDKAMAKQVLGSMGIPQVRHLAFREDDVGPGLAEQVEAKLGWPVFVKPANLGSSVGVTRAADPASLERSFALALSYDEWVVVEEAVAAREIEVAVLGNWEPQASVPGEVVPAHEFYDYEDKYVDGNARLLVPAPLRPEEASRVRQMAAAAFAALRCEGMARVDFFYEEKGRGFLVNEINTIPGFTPISMYPKLWEESGLSYAHLLDRLIELSLERHSRRLGRIGRGRVS